MKESLMIPYIIIKPQIKPSLVLFTISLRLRLPKGRIIRENKSEFCGQACEPICNMWCIHRRFYAFLDSAPAFSLEKTGLKNRNRARMNRAQRNTGERTWFIRYFEGGVQGRIVIWKKFFFRVTPWFRTRNKSKERQRLEKQHDVSSRC